MTFDYCLKFNQAPVRLSRRVFEQLIDAPWLQALCGQIAAGDKEKKRELPAVMWQATFEGKKRANANAISSGLFQLDVDHADPDEIWARVRPRLEELGIYVVHKTASREGIRIVAKCRPGFRTLLENQLWLAGQIEVKPDTACKDFARLGFVCQRSYFYHYNPAIFEEKPVVVLENTGTSLQPDNSSQAASAAATTGSQSCDNASSASASAAAASSSASSFSTDYDGIPYPALVEALADQLGGVPVHGSRNNFLFSMACHLRYVCNDDPDWIRQVLPSYGEASDRVYRTIQSACCRAQSRCLPELVKRAINVARSQCIAGGTWNPVTAGQATMGTWAPGVLAAPLPPELPKRLPRLIRLLTDKVHPMYKPAVAMAVFPALGAHLHGVKTRYIDNSISDLGGFMSVCMAKQSIGKGSVNMPIDLIMEDIVGRDNHSREQEKQWKARCRQAKSTEKKPARPEGLCVQYLMSNMTNAALVQRLLDAEAAGDKFLYTKLDEIELLDQIKATGGATASEIIRLAFTQSLYGQERVGSESVTGTPPLRFNFNASTTISGGQKYLRDGLTNGTLSRLTISTIIKAAGQRGIPRYGDYDEQFRQALAPFIANLNAASGLIECKQVSRMSEQLCEENEDLYELSDDDVFQTLSYRANRIAHDKALLLYIAQDYQWTRDIADFCRWAEQYDLWCKLRFFGKEMHDQTSLEQLPVNVGPRNMLDMLPDRFSRQDLQAVHRAQGRTGEVMQLIYTWTNRGYISPDENTGEYVKTEAYLVRHRSVPG